MSKKSIIISAVVFTVIIAAGGVWWTLHMRATSSSSSNFISYKDRGLTAEEKAVYQSKVVELKEQLKNATNDNEKFKLTMQIGIQHYALGEFTLAQERYLTAAKILPDNPTVWSELYIIENARGDYASAKKHIEKAIELNPASAQYWRWRIELEKDQFSPDSESMNSLFSQALANTNNSVEILAIQARYFESIGSNNAAIDTWKRLKEVNPSATAIYDQEIADLMQKVQ